ncbi:MAG: aldo/keto reductase [Oscillospiraceae bacterium]|nr:aldo/keto reductase [Oscillospiraceae bacterium]
MQYRTDPKSGQSLPVLGLGCMRFPRGKNTRIDMEKTEKMLLSAIERGVNYLDTAYIYSGSEQAVGKILEKNGLREKVLLATKLPHGKCRAYEDFDKFFNIQLERLRTDYIDYYLIHNLGCAADWERLRPMGIERWIAEKKAAGQIRQIGFSFHGAQNGFLELLEAYPWEFTLMQYNYMDENNQAGRAGLRRAHAMGLPVFVMEPLLGGKLASGLPARALKLFQEAGGGDSPAVWALRWLWDQPEVSLVLSGMSSMAQLDENIQAAENALPGRFGAREAELFERVAAVFRESYRVPCTGCNYCMPCPKKVNIPGCFAAYNASYAIHFPEGVKQYVMATGAVGLPGNNASARNCVQCGLCEKKCPQRIAVAQSLRAVSRRLEPLPLRVGYRIGARLTK